MRTFHPENGTHIKDEHSNRKMMKHLLIALLPIIVFSIYKNGYIPYSHNLIDIFGLIRPILMFAVAILTCSISELLYYIFVMKGKEYKDFMLNSYATIPGILLVLILPINTPLLIIVIGSLFASIFGKMVYGGFGHNIFNPALIGRLFIMGAYALNIVNVGGYLNAYELDTISSSTPLTNTLSISGIGTYSQLVKPFGNLWDFLFGFIPGSIGETSAILILFAFVYLVLTKVIKWVIPTIYVLTVFVMVYIIASFNDVGVWFALFHVLSGGLLFGAVFMTTDPVTSPTSLIGQILYGLFLGIITVTLRFLMPEPESVMTSILIMNIFVYSLDKLGAFARFNFNKVLIPFMIAWSLIIGMSLYIGSTLKTPVVVNNDFNIISKVTSGNQVTYDVTQKGYSGLIKATIIFENDLVVSFVITEQHESFYQHIIDADYLNTLLAGQTDITNVDTVSGATSSSKSIKTLFINTLEDYNGK